MNDEFVWSYSNLTLWETRPYDFALRIIKGSGHRLPTLPMAAGLGFDYEVKCQLAERTGQVVLPQRPPLPDNLSGYARAAGDGLWEVYRRSAAARELFGLVALAETSETDSRSARTIDGVPIHGVSDLTVFTERLCVLDWKVKGYGSATGASPSPGYLWCDGLAHPLAKPFYTIDGLTINSTPLDAFNTSYADQLATYFWLEGAEVGDVDPVGMIHEIVSRPTGVRIAVHAGHVSAEYQRRLLDRYKTAQANVAAGYIFRDKSLDDNKRMLDEMRKSLELAAVHGVPVSK